MPRKKSDTQRIQLIATKDIYEWWNDLPQPKSKGESENQEKLREAVRVGLSVLNGSLLTVSPERLKQLEAIEIVFKSGFNGNLSAPLVEKEVKVEKSQRKIPDIGRARSSIQTARNQ